MKTILAYLFLLFLFQLSIPQRSFSQASSGLLIKDLKLKKGSVKNKVSQASEKEKMKLLKMLPEGERIEFVMEYNENEGDTLYYPFSTMGLYFLDLDFDGDLDLLYSGQGGTMMRTSTKIYYNNENSLIYHSTLADGILDIIKEESAYILYTLFLPCCDSYTTIIKNYRFSSNETAQYNGSISLINKKHTILTRMPDFESKTGINLENPSIYTLPQDFHNGFAYFGKRDREIDDLLKKKMRVELLKLEGKVNFKILGETQFKDQKYYLVISETLSNLPQRPISLYEWSYGDNRRLIGWVVASNID